VLLRLLTARHIILLSFREPLLQRNPEKVLKTGETANSSFRCLETGFMYVKLQQIGYIYGATISNGFYGNAALYLYT